MTTNDERSTQGVPHPDPIADAPYSAMELLPGDDVVVMLDQRELPARELYHRLETVDDVARGIRDMIVRGAPAIGISAAYGFVLAAKRGRNLDEAAALLKAARPTAVNLFWAVDRMVAVAGRTTSADRPERLAAEARAIHREDVESCRRMGRHGAERIPDGATILTHCNTGGLATGGYGTALGVIRAAHEAGKRVQVLADETRPYLQGARLTAWELKQLGIPVSVIADGAAAHFFSRGDVALAIVGSDRIAANGDVANKIGTFGVACAARFHERPFYVAAPWSTVDVRCPSGDAIVIEERDATEVTHLAGRRLVPEGVSARNPAFDVTPARLVTAIFTERGVIEPVGPGAVAALSRSE
ncbi:MAG TPA: S-methyl-5-thioribose-1-phosphate isomerase [Polyangiaceae bacterium]|jgi:methylthioribose-1-phosphate isomerase|nr:S-methyl-5-thioribose-1-phosphate isomerase [Polyangiaceae bacterium]